MVIDISVSNLIIASVVLGLVTSLIRYLFSRGKNYNFKGELVYDIFSSPALISILVVIKAIVTDSAHTHTLVFEDNMLVLEYIIFLLMLLYSGYILISYHSFKYAKTFKEAFNILLQKFLNLSYLLFIGIVIKLIIFIAKDTIGDSDSYDC